jgi:transcriptional regulator with XRE-family HTH domain
MKSTPRQFYKIGGLVREYRELVCISQLELAKKLGYKNGQFISNLERGICTIPYDKIALLSLEIKVAPVRIIEAMCDDFKTNIKHVVNGSL